MIIMAVKVIIPVMHVMAILAPITTTTVIPITTVMVAIYKLFYIGCYGNSCSYELNCNCHNSCNGHHSCNNCIGCNYHNFLMDLMALIKGISLLLVVSCID